ncbi:MAG: hypothetical protein ACFHVJ_00605 [Aestuariibacter sp.]
MKKLLTFATLLAFSFNLFAASGQASFPPFEITYFTPDDFKRAWINVSNITDEPVTVKFTLYDDAGNVVTDGDNSPSTGPIRAQYNFSSYSDSIAGQSGQFVLQANSSARLWVHGNGTPTMMYGTIAWEQDSKATVALLSNIMIDRFYRQTYRQSSHTQNIVVNGGEAF